MNRLAQSLGDAAQELEDMFKMPGRVAPDKIESMNGIFHNHYLDAKMKAFTDGIAKSQEGIVDIEEYINEEDLDLHIHKKLLEMAPDLFTSIGILGTFVGLVWGLKDRIHESSGCKSEESDCCHEPDGRTVFCKNGRQF